MTFCHSWMIIKNGNYILLYTDKYFMLLYHSNVYLRGVQYKYPLSKMFSKNQTLI